MSDHQSQGAVPEVVLSADTLVKLLDISKNDIRAFRSLYMPAFAIALIALGMLINMQRDFGAQALTEWALDVGLKDGEFRVAAFLYLMPCATSMLALYLLSRGLWLASPNLEYRDLESEIIGHVEAAVSSKTSAKTIEYLQSAVRTSHCVQGNLVRSAKYMRLGIVLSFFAAALEYTVSLIRFYGVN